MAPSRPRLKKLSSTPGGEPSLSDDFVQIQRMGNALINELLIGTGDKDKFSMSEPEDDAQFANYLLDPLLARVINAAYGGAVPIPTPPRLDLAPLVLYAPPICPACTTPALQGPIADFLRLNTGILPTSRADRKRLGVLAGDLAGYPNGRRVSDDVTHISCGLSWVCWRVLRSTVSPTIALGTGSIPTMCPTRKPSRMAFANSGRNSQHQDPGFAGCFDSVTFAPIDCPTD